MTELAKATLTELDASNRTVDPPVAVQFNPASLRMQLSNRNSGGAQAGGPTRQRAGEGAVSLNFDLQFDTADEGSAEAPVSVLRKTAAVERFVRPRGTQPGDEAPPRVQFEWGAVKLQGVMDSLSLDLELFAFDGTPLRARCAVSIKGQDAAYRFAPSEAGTGAGGGTGSQAAGNTAAGAVPTPPGGRAAGALAAVDKAVRAAAGESLPQLAVRAGLDPKDWRALRSQATDPQNLPAGQEVGVPAGAGAGSGGGAGAGSGTNSSTGSSGSPIVDAIQNGAIGNALQALSQRGTAGAAGTSAAMALTRAGGVAAAQTQWRRDLHGGQTGQALAGFGLGPARGNGNGSGSSNPDPLALPDDRPYGHGLPLKPRRAVAAAAGLNTTSTATTARSRWRSACACAGRCGC